MTWQIGVLSTLLAIVGAFGCAAVVEDPLVAYDDEVELVGEGQAAAFGPSPIWSVKNKRQLLRALRRARQGHTIRIDPTAVIDLSGESALRIHDGVYLDGGRRAGNGGALLFSRSFTGYAPLLRAKNDVLIRGIRLRGPYGGVGSLSQPSDAELAVGLVLMPGGAGNVVRDCEFFNWPASAISVVNSTDNDIHHNQFHHNRRTHRGYAITITAPHPQAHLLRDPPQSDALIRRNFFDYNRHAIAGTGYPGESYEARRNYIGPNDDDRTHMIDMHGLGERGEFPSSLRVAGRRIHVHHNTILRTGNYVFRIRGVPEDRAIIEHNCVATSLVAQQLRYSGNFVQRENTLRGKRCSKRGLHDLVMR